MTPDFQRDIDAVQAVAAVPAILDVTCRITGMRFAAIARVTEDRWITCSSLDNLDFGLKPGDELKVESTICHEIRQSREAVAIDDVSSDIAYCGHRTPAMYGFKSYISVPIVLPDGFFFGTLCAIDPEPAKLNTPQVVGMLKLFAELIAFHLAADLKLRAGDERYLASQVDLYVSEARLEASEVNLLDERATAELREQFIAVLGHDLRNPLASIGAGVRLLVKSPLDDKGREVLRIMQLSVMRIAKLVDNLMDFARGRLGGGLTLERRAEPALGTTLHQVVDELQSLFPDRAIEAKVDLPGAVDVDRAKIGQLYSNLVANALAYGDEDKPIRTRACVEDGEFILSVANNGVVLSREAIERLFKPFQRGAVRPSQAGLGLGLYIAAEIARAHGGRIDVTSTPEETRFTFRMPV